MNELTHITQPFIENICTKIRRNEPVRIDLPVWGRIHIDRQLPFLCLYRKPAHREDIGTDRLVISEASYILADASLSTKGLKELIDAIAQTMREEFGAFLLLEVWSRCEEEQNQTIEEQQQEVFTIYSHKRGLLTPVVETLKNQLHHLKINQIQAEARIKHTHTIAPYKMEPVLQTSALEKENIFMIGLAVKPLYHNSNGHELYPFELNKLRKGISRAFKKTFFQFVKRYTSTVPVDYRELGRRGITKTVFNIDNAIAKIEDSFDFLLQVSPVNSKEAWETFKQSNYKTAPRFFYRPRPFDPALMKREMFKIPLEKIEDPLLYTLFLEKRDEIDRKLTMLNDRGSIKFLYGSLQVYGAVEDSLLQKAKEILKALSKLPKVKKESEQVDAETFAKAAMEEIAYYQKTDPSINAKVELREDISSGAMVSNGNFLIYKYSQFPKNRIEPLIHHEIGTHILTYFNGLSQPFKQLHTGLCGYDEMQEGIAVLSEYLCGGLTRNRVKTLAGRVIAVDAMINGATFTETFHLLKEEYGFMPRTAFTITMRVYRGGGLTKDAVYLRGFLNIFDYIASGGALDLLFVGKIAASHIPLVKELLLRKVLHEPLLYPRYLETEEARERLEKIKNGYTILDIITKEMK
jgi:uncharacterized protein (TIGR02421 family)